ncbi:lysyl-tRNA synthetase [Entomophthora muscae]|uniref:Lysyl-tRNA synthetase n=1 Tax=Entomophthora muscae TaxID=34485 RepID=A0ACC2SH24_9FUNG|nr:lysyl-tRNA synthetase [Entomophthora muscae]
MSEVPSTSGATSTPGGTQPEKLYLDEVTGEMVSKSEIKRRTKQREKDAKKATQAPKPEAVKKETSDEAAEDSLNPNQYFEIRSKAVKKLQAEGKSPYPHKFNVSMSIPAFMEKYSYLQAGERAQDVVSVSGRIHNKRSSGAKLRFL